MPCPASEFGLLLKEKGEREGLFVGLLGSHCVALARLVSNLTPTSTSECHTIPGLRDFLSREIETS